MTSPLQQKIKITGPSIVTANRTWDGTVVYRTNDGWSVNLSDATVVSAAETARALLAAAAADDVGAVGPYIAPVRIGENGKQFYIGDRFDGTANEEGRLFVLIVPSPFDDRPLDDRPLIVPSPLIVANPFVVKVRSLS